MHGHTLMLLPLARCADNWGTDMLWQAYQATISSSGPELMTTQDGKPRSLGGVFWKHLRKLKSRCVGPVETVY